MALTHDKTPPLKQNASANDTQNGSRKRDQLKKITGANARGVTVGTLKRGPPLRVGKGKGRKGPAHGRASPPPHSSRGNHTAPPHA
eukprot:scaffold10948_cov132-Isochrysis_galbana.AAC.6